MAAVETFFSYKNYRWMWLNLLLLVGLVAAYVKDTPLGGPNGGTTLGLAYGIFAAVGIAYLMWYGMRKRSYHARFTTLKGCLSAHVWLGISLAIIVPLHAGFQFGCNVHTLTYALMMFVVASGVWGGVQYLRLADQIDSHRGGGVLKKIIEQIYLLSKEMDKKGEQKSDQFIKLIRTVDFQFKPSLFWSAKRLPDPTRKEVTTLIAKLPEGEQNDALNLVGIASKKRELALRLAHEVHVSNLLKGWLYLHVPLSCALVMCLFIHIITVLYYR